MSDWCVVDIFSWDLKSFSQAKATEGAAPTPGLTFFNRDMDIDTALSEISIQADLNQILKQIAYALRRLGYNCRWVIDPSVTASAGIVPAAAVSPVSIRNGRQKVEVYGQLVKKPDFELFDDGSNGSTRSFLEIKFP